MFYFKVNHLNKSTKFRDWLSSNDLFVLVKYGNQVRRTTVKWNNNNPVWNEVFLLMKLMRKQYFYQFMMKMLILNQIKFKSME